MRCDGTMCAEWVGAGSSRNGFKIRIMASERSRASDVQDAECP